MHLSALRTRLFCISTNELSLFIKHCRLFSSHRCESKADDHSRPVENVLSWEKYHAKEVGRRPVKTNGVIVEDLRGTLENQRARNKALITTSIEAPSRTSAIESLASASRHDSRASAKIYKRDGSICSDSDYLDGHRCTIRRVAKALQSPSADLIQPKSKVRKKRRDKAVMKIKPTKRSKTKTHPESREVLEHEDRPWWVI